MTFKPKPMLRKEAEIDISAAIRGVVWSQFMRTDIYPFKNCLNCLNWNKTKEICNQFKARPPADVICYGCPEHDDIEEIPF